MIKQISVIAAVDNSYGFGKDGKIPWHYPEDFKFFKTKTENSVVIMGKATYDDLVGYTKGDNFLPTRECIVLTRSTETPPYDNVTFVTNHADALEKARTFDREVFYIGGENVFTYGLSVADTVYLTHINKYLDCDKFFPMDKLSQHFMVGTSTASEKHSELTYKTYVRNK